MKKLLFTILVISSMNTFSQIDESNLEHEIVTLNSKVKNLQSSNANLSKEINSIEQQLITANQKIAELDSIAKSNGSAIDATNQNLGLKISTNETSTNEKLSEVDQSLSNTSLYTIIGILIAVLVSGIVYLLLSKRQKVDKTDLIEQLSVTKSSIEESLVQEFGKQTELMETQIKLLENSTTVSNSASNEIDHSLALRVADEITLIERNISLMDSSVKGLKQLNRSVSKLRDNLMANGYEITELLGKSYDQGMKVIVVSSLPDENLSPDDEIITKIIKPQVLFNGQMIQTAQIETSKGI